LANAARFRAFKAHACHQLRGGVAAESGGNVKRSRLALLSVLGLLLVSGQPVMPTVDAGPPVAVVPPKAAQVAPVGAPAGFGAAEIVAILREVNPQLSEGELGRISAAVLYNSAKYDIDPQLVMAVMWEESDARPWARSPKGAIGLMQVMPHMSAKLEIAGNLTTIEKNVEAGCLILADNIRRLGTEDGISAYFWGSRIRDVSYLNRILEKRAFVRRLSES
jgi:hypothetical protein